MVSNSLSARRGPLRRPKVCYDSSKVRGPDVTHPPGRMICAITPASKTLDLFEWFWFFLSACDSGSEMSSPVAVLTDGQGGSFNPLEGLENCNEIPAEFMADVAGKYIISAQYTSQANRICIAYATVIVNP